MRCFCFLGTASVIKFTLLVDIMSFADVLCGIGGVFLELEVGSESGDACPNDDDFHFGSIRFM